MAGDSGESHAPVALGALHGLDRPSRAEDLIHFLERAQVMKLPQVEVIGPQPLQAVVEQLKRCVARARVRLRSEEYRATRCGPGGAEGDAVIVLALLVRGRGVAISDPQTERLQNYRDCFSAPSRGATDPLAAQRDGKHSVPGLPQQALGASDKRRGRR